MREASRNWHNVGAAKQAYGRDKLATATQVRQGQLDAIFHQAMSGQVIRQHKRNEATMTAQKAKTEQKLRGLLAILPNLATEDLRCLLWLLHLLEPKSDRQFLLSNTKAKIASCVNVKQFVDMAELMLRRNKERRPIQQVQHEVKHA